MGAPVGFSRMPSGGRRRTLRVVCASSSATAIVETVDGTSADPQTRDPSIVGSAAAPILRASRA